MGKCDNKFYWLDRKYSKNSNINYTKNQHKNRNNRKMQLQKIQKQVHTSSILVCCNDPQVSFKSATWYRKPDLTNTRKLIKKDCLMDKTQSSHSCSIFDFGCFIELELENCEGQLLGYQYGPVKLDRKMLAVVESSKTDCRDFDVDVVLNKTQIFGGILSFGLAQTEMLTMCFKLEQACFDIQHAKPNRWIECSQIFEIRCQTNPQRVNMKLGSNKLPFIKNLAPLNIFCHYGNYLNVNFKNVQERDRFMLNVIAIIQFDKHNRGRFPVNLRKSSIKMSEINLVFSSTDCFTTLDTTSPCNLSENNGENNRSIILTPKPSVDHSHEDKDFISLQSFIGNQKTKQTIKTIKEQEQEQDPQVRRPSKSKNTKSIHNEDSRRSSNHKSHEFIFACNKKRDSMNLRTRNERLLKSRSQFHKTISREKIHIHTKSKQKQPASKNKPDSKADMPVGYQQILQKLKALQQQNQQLIKQNKALCRRIESLQKRKQKQPSPVPHFILSRKNNHQPSTQHMISRPFKRYSDGRERRQRYGTTLHSIMKAREHSETVIGGDSNINSPSSSYAPYKFSVHQPRNLS